MRSSSSPDRRSAALALLVVVSVACGGGGGHGGERPTPTPAPTTTPVTTPSPTPGPTPTAVPNPFTIAAAVVPGTQSAAAFGGGRYLTTFSLPGAGPGSAVYGLRLAASGGAIDDAPLLLSGFGSGSFLDPADTSYDGAAIGFDGASFGVFFAGRGSVATNPGFPGQMVGFASVPLAGPPIQPPTEVDTQASFGMVQTSIAGVTGASNVASRLVGLYRRGTAMIGFPFVIGQVDGADVTVAGGSVTVQSRFVLAGGSRGGDVVESAATGSIASNGAVALAAWLQTGIDVAPPEPPHVSATTLAGALITPAGTTPVALADTASGTGATSVASDGSAFLVVWSSAPPDGSSPPNEVRAIRYLPAGDATPGVVAPPGGFLVAGGPAAKSLAGVAFAGGTWLVVWNEEGVLQAARIPEDGATATTFTLDAGPVEDAAVTSDGARFLVVLEKPNGATNDLLGLFVDATD